MKVGLSTETIYIKNKRIDLQRQNHLLVFGKGENFSNCKQIRQGSCIKLILNEEFSPFHHVKFQLHNKQQIIHNQQNFLLLNWKNTQLKNRDMKICDAIYTFDKVLGHFLFVTLESQILICPNFPQSFQGSQLRTQHWTVHSQKTLQTIRDCNNTNGRYCQYSLITQRGYLYSRLYRCIVNLILKYNIHTTLRPR